MKTLFFRVLVVLTLVVMSQGSALACAACYGDTSGSKMGNAASVGIFAMVVIMFAMLGTIFGFGVYFARRAKQTFPDYDELLGDNATEPNPGTSS